MNNRSHNGPDANKNRDFAQMLSKLSDEELIRLFDDLGKALNEKVQQRKTGRQKQLANMTQSVAHGLDLLKKRLKLMNIIREFKGRPSVLRGYHGTTRFAAEQIRDEIKKGNPAPFQESRNEWDWLGYGVYFWLEAPHRAAERALWWYWILMKQRPWLPDLFDHDKYPPPEGHHSHFAVIEARIRLFPETTLNLLDTSWVEELKYFKDKFTARVEEKLEPEKTLAKSNYRVVSETREELTEEGLVRKRVKLARANPEGEMRTRDCQLFNEFRKEFPEIQCIVAAFREGQQIIPEVNVWDKDHVQINVVDQSAIDYSPKRIEVHDAAKWVDVTKFKGNGKSPA